MNAIVHARPQRLDRRALDRAWARLAQAPEAPWLHAEVARRMAERLGVIRQRPRRVLDWWGELGASGAALAAAYPAAEIAVVHRLDPSAAAPAAPSWRRWLGLAPAPARQGLAAGAVPPQQAQLVWCNMGLHWADDAPPLLRAWQKALAVDGFLMFSTLGPGTLGLVRELYAREGWGPPYPPWTDMHDLGDMLVEAGFADPVMDQEVVRLTYSGPEAALAELRTLGANMDASRFAGLRTPRWRERLLEHLRDGAGPAGRVVLEFEVVYGHAFRPAPRARVTAETAVELSEMRTLLQRGRGDKKP